MPSRDRDHAREIDRGVVIPGASDSYPARGPARRTGAHAALQGNAASPAQAGGPVHASGPVQTGGPAHARPPRSPATQAALVPYLAVLVCVAAGIYIAWHQGSNGGGRGGVIAGAALLAAAMLRLVLPARMSGLLAVRNRATDAVTLIVLGACLLATGLVLPGLRGRDPHKGLARGPPMKGKHGNVED